MALMASQEIRSFLDAVAEWRKSFRVSFAKIGDRTGLDPSTIYRVLSGETENPSFRVVSTIAEAFGTSLDKILKGEFRPEQIVQMGYSPLASKSGSENRGISMAERPGVALPLGGPKVPEPFTRQADGVSSRAESEYSAVLKEELDTIKMFGSPDVPNVPVDLLHTFVSLDIAARPEGWYQESLEPNKMRRETDRRLSPESVIKRTMKKHRMLLILGDPGSGKTTLMKYYAMLCLRDRHVELGFDEAILPIYLPLREVESTDSGLYPLHECLAKRAKQNYLRISADTFFGWLKNRQTLVLLDGLDEISDLYRRQEICEWIDKAAKGLEKARFVVTSRWTGYRKADGIELEFDHVKAEVRDFSPEQQKEFLEKWFVAAYLREPRSKGIPKQQWRKRQKQKGLGRAKAIVDFLAEDENKGVRELATVPMLLQMIAILWRERENLPEGRAELYQAAVKYLLVYRDRLKRIKVILPATKMLRVLRPVSFWMQHELHCDEVKKEHMHGYMQPILDTMEDGLDAGELCANLRDRAGLIADYGKDSYIFRHKSFREYLAGQELFTKAERDTECFERIVRRFGEDWWNEPLRFFMGEVDDALFDQFMDAFFRSDASKELDQRSYNLLLTMVSEAPQRRIDSLVRRLNDADSSENQRRYILDCLKTIGNKSAFEGIRAFGEKETETEVGIFAQSIIAEEKVLPALESPITADLFKKLPASFRNPLEWNAEYIHIPAGRFVYSATKKAEQVSDIYVARHAVTNKRYRQFIRYLEGNDQGLSEILPLTLFSKRMLKFAEKIDDFTSHLGSETGTWAQQLRSRFDQEKRFKGDDHPVVGVSWFGARAYCFWLSLLDEASQRLTPSNLRHEYRLLTDVEWEWAASGGRREYPWPAEKGPPSEKLANYRDNVGATTPVGRYPEGATPDGLMNMAGNVWEWMENYDEKDKKALFARYLRGGAWDSRENYLSCSCRDWLGRAYGLPYVGFRVVLSQS